MWPFGKKNPTDELWSWFRKHGETFRDPRSLDPRAIEKLGRLLSAIEDGIVYEFVMADGRANELVISADGRPGLFGTVIDIVNAAPSLAGWKITAFRQPGPMTGTIEMGDVKLSYEDIWFQSSNDGGRTNLVLGVRGMTEENHQQLAGAVFILLDDALGEFVAGTSLGAVDFADLPADPPSKGFRPLVEVTQVVKRIVQ
ncbi:MAG: hypothetical protein IPL61_35935 [Myxococcales bacterium]|nr:hypothetical protein [Myxococcales bacterium]